MEANTELVEVETPIVETPEAVVETPVVETPTEPVEAKVEPVAPQQEKIISFDDGLKEYGFTKEELDEIKLERAAKKAESEKPLEEQKDWANKLQFGITEKLITKEEVDKHTILSAKSDKELVFEKFDFDNPDDLEKEELEAAKLEAFNEIYHQNSENAKAKAKGEEALQIEAAKIRNEFAEKITKVNSEYTERQISQNFHADRQAILKELNENGYSETIEVEGVKLEVKIPVEMTEAQAKEMLTSDEGAHVLKLMRDVYKDNKDGANQFFREFVVNSQKSKAIAKTAYQAGRDAEKAISEVTSIGATAPFNAKENIQHTAAPNDEDNKKAVKKAMGLTEY